MAFRIAALTCAIFLSSAGAAHAYIDPSAGSLILQGIVGGIAGGLFIMRSYWMRFTGWLPWNRTTAKDEKTGAADESAAETR
ncbi:MAG: hypothetical protein AAGD92_01100 [Pseudomonadota bacterium]